MINQQSNKQAFNLLPPAEAQYEHPIKTLIGSLISAITRYDCATEDPNSCPSWRAVKLSLLLARGKVDCDEVADNKICMAARKLLGDEDASDVEIRKGLKEVIKSVKNQEQMSKLKGVFAGVREYVCWRQPDMEYCVK